MLKKNKQRINFLMSCVSGLLSRVVIESLNKSTNFNLQVHGVDAGPIPKITSALLLKTATVPMGCSPEYLSVILTIIQQWRIDVFWPASDDEVQLVSRHREKFHALGCRLLIGSEEVITLLGDKCSVYDRLKKANIYVPPYALGTNEVDVWKAMIDFGYPRSTVVVKPSTGRGNRGLNVFLGQQSAPDWLGSGKRERRHLPNAISASDQLRGLIEERTIIMPALSEPAYDVDVLGRKSDAAQVVIRKRHNPSGIPFAGNEIILAPAIMDYCCAVADALNLDSLFDMDLLTGPKSVCLLEINPRPSGSLAVSLFAGFPILDVAIADLFGDRINIDLPIKEMTVLPHIANANSLCFSDGK